MRNRTKMKLKVSDVFLILLISLTIGGISISHALADTLSSAAIGWTQLTTTKIRPVCPNPALYPNIQGVEGCSAVTADWSSGVFDTARNRLIVWGGGHNGYLGNEIYALNLNESPITMTRLNNPSTQPPTALAANSSTGDGQASSRHTYDHIVYMSHVDRMFVFGGASPPYGFMLDDTWTFNFASMTWQKMSPSGTKPEANYGRATVYSPAAKKVYIHDQFSLYSYSVENDAYTTLSNEAPVGQEMTGVLDSKRQTFISVGNGAVTAFDLSSGSNFKMQTWATTGGASILNYTNPGVAYDPISDRIVAWAGGNTVYTLDPAASNKVWVAVTYPGGPGAALGNGTFKRFAYSPASNAFVVVNSVDSDAFALKLTPGAGTGTGMLPGLSAPKNLKVQ